MSLRIPRRAFNTFLLPAYGRLHQEVLRVVHVLSKKHVVQRQHAGHSDPIADAYDSVQRGFVRYSVGVPSVEEWQQCHRVLYGSTDA